MKGAMSLEGGGPVDGEHVGVLAWAVERHRPEYFCTTSNDVWHHYVNVPGSDPVRYTYGGLCDGIEHACGEPHDHGCVDCGQAGEALADGGGSASAAGSAADDA